MDSFEEMAVEFVQNPSFPLNIPTVVEDDNVAFTAVKVLTTSCICTNLFASMCSSIMGYIVLCIVEKKRAT